MTRIVRYTAGFISLLLLLTGITLLGQSALDIYQQALVQSRGAGNLEEAIKLFELAARQAGEDHGLAAKALLGAADSYEKLGQARAYVTYQELLHKYADQRIEASTARTRLDRLSKAVRSNFETAKVGEMAPGWYRAGNMRPFINPQVVEDGCFEGLRCILLPTTDNPPTNWFNTIGIELNATPYLNQKVRFRAAVRPEAAEARAQMWLRVDRQIIGNPDHPDSSFFHNAGTIRATNWDHYSIVGTVSPDSKIIFFGVVTHGLARVWVDDVTFEIVSPDEPTSKNMASRPGDFAIRK